MFEHVAGLIGFLILNEFTFRLKLRSVIVLLKNHYKIYKLKLVRKLIPNGFDDIQREFMLVESKMRNRGCFYANQRELSFTFVT